MKILHLVTQSEAGGAQAIASRLASDFRGRGIDSFVWFFYRKSRAYDDEKKGWWFLDRAPKWYVVPFLTIRVAKKIRKERIDVVFCHTHYANIVGGLAARLAGVKKVIAVHTSPYETYPSW